jgi:hypothetical protein
LFTLRHHGVILLDVAPQLRHDGAMDLRPHVDQLRHELTIAAEAGGEEARALAARLLAPLESATRLTLLNALTIAADEISRELAPGSVEVRLRGLDPSFVVQPAERQDEPEAALSEPPAALPEPADGPTARINFRPPEGLKTRIDEAAAREGQSVNAWLVRIVTAALNQGPGRVEQRRTSTGERHHIGWVR